MPVQDCAVDDCELLKLLETGLGELEASKQLNVSPGAVQARVKAYLQGGILQPNGEREKVDWPAYGRWVRARKTSEAA